MHWKTLIVLVSIVVVYILTGAAIFLTLERQPEVVRKGLAQTTFMDFIDNNTCVTREELETFIKIVILAHDSGVQTSPNQHSYSRWNYGGSIFFAITVITTIGYGDLAPSSPAGQLFFIIYAIIGIPLCAIMLVGLGEILARPYLKFEQIKPFTKFLRAEKIFRMVLFTSVCFSIFSLMPAAIIMNTENWTYLEAWYFTIVTLTTVGFGDFVPDDPANESPLYKIVAGIWIFCGLAWLSMVFHMISFYIRSLTNKMKAEDFEIKVEDGHEEVTDVSTPDKEPLQKEKCPNINIKTTYTL